MPELLSERFTSNLIYVHILICLQLVIDVTGVKIDLHRLCIAVTSALFPTGNQSRLFFAS